VRSRNPCDSYDRGVHARRGARGDTARSGRFSSETDRSSSAETNVGRYRDLRAEVLAGRFREDLFYRLSSIQIRIPSLSERLEDIPLLVQFFLKKYNDAYGKAIAGLTRRAQTVLLQHPWPGNVRELENVISTACITATGDFIDLSDLPEHLQHRPARLPGDEDWQPLSLDEVRKVHIQKVLQMCNGNRLRAAQILGIGRTSLYRYLKRDGYDNSAARAHTGMA
jgi:DNA-binding NtrC family response regulator